MLRAKGTQELNSTRAVVPCSSLGDAIKEVLTGCVGQHMCVVRRPAVVIAGGFDPSSPVQVRLCHCPVTDCHCDFTTSHCGSPVQASTDVVEVYTFTGGFQ